MLVNPGALEKDGSGVSDGGMDDIVVLVVVVVELWVAGIGGNE